MMPIRFADPRFVIAYTVILGFMLAYLVAPDDATMKGALIAGFSGAWGFYLGSSSGSAVAREQVGQALDIAQAASAPPEPASSSTQETKS